jgi:hypothetical protein
MVAMSALVNWVGEHLRRARLSHGLSLDQPAYQSGVARAGIVNLEAGRADKRTLPSYKGECYVWTGDISLASQRLESLSHWSGC